MAPVTAPSGLRAKAAANLDAIRVLRTIDSARRQATPDERETLGRWSAWGALPKIFDETDTEWTAERADLHDLLSAEQWDAARRTTINAHYTPPQVVAAMWEAVRLFGHTGGLVLEPGCGAGSFLAGAPDVKDCTGIELDPTTAAICKALYPQANVRCEPFEDTRFPDGWFDLAIGNVPFGDIVVHDARHNTGRHTMHNHFIVKSLSLVRPGGLAALITSRYTLDSQSGKHREEIAGLAGLVGAVRLPAGAMKATAGTDVIVDVLFFRRHDEDGVAAGPAWQEVVTVDVDGGPMAVNEYFATRPHLVLGTIKSGRGMYRDGDMVVTPYDDRLYVRLREAVARVAVTPPVYIETGSTARAEPTLSKREPHELGAEATQPFHRQMDAETATCPADKAEQVAAAEQRPDARKARARKQTAITPREAPASDQYRPGLHQEGSILRTSDRGFCQLQYGQLVPFTPTSKKDEAELTALVDLRDTVLTLLDAQAGSDDDSRFAGYQTELNGRYDNYVVRYGPLNRYTLAHSGKFDEDGDEKLRRLRPRMGGFGEDPAFHTVMALEHFDADDQTAEKADIFRRRVVGPRVQATTAATADEALSICLDELGHVDLGRIAGLLGQDPDAARAALATLVWDTPDGQTLTASEYLSGNVRYKLTQARLAAERDGRWQANVDALAAVMPDDLGPAEIDARLGSPWLEASDIEKFIDETFLEETTRRNHRPNIDVDHSKINATWEISLAHWLRNSLLMTSTWGTTRADAISILHASLNQTPATVYDVVDRPQGGTTRVVNVEETFLAREKQQAISDRFREWVWEDPDRAERIAERYNRLFNSTVLPTYDGSHLTLPGLNLNFTPHPHQRNAIWRIISSPTALLAHPVGAGKTMASAAAGLEMRRLGLVSKPAFIVPNHMLDQYASEMLQLYPQAKILVPTKKETTKAGRKNFVARCAMGDWDAIVITHSAFERLAVSPATARRFLTAKLADYRAAADADGASKMTVKKLEASCARLEGKIRTLLNAEEKDDGVNFEATGIDYLFADESQFFKSLPFASHNRSISHNESQRAADLELKLTYLREKVGDRVATFSTATPIANTIAEMYVVQKYLQPDRLDEAGIGNFDAWAATFGSTVTNLELAPDGGSYRMNTRFARFHNVPELVTMFREVADVLTPADLALPIPEVHGGKPQTVIVSPSVQLKDYVADLVERAKAVRERRVHPTEDNMLKVCGDGRKAALDMRLVGHSPDPAGGKIAACATRVADIYKQHADKVYMGLDGPLDRRGSFQLVFCDLGTPRATWNVYEQLKGDLVLRGVPEDMIRFVHSATDARAKAELFAACRAGRIAVLVGSTDKMGIGTNVQTRLAALHHLDCPWRPDQIEQRDGRGLRQGNHNSTVAVNRYATEGSFDVYMWQTVERKAHFIHQVMRGDITSREIEDVSEQALSYAEIKALATGNPLIMEKAGVDNDVARLQRLRRAHTRDQAHVSYRLANANDRADAATNRIALCEAAITQRRIPAEFELEVGGFRWRERTAAGEAYRQCLHDIVLGPALDIPHQVGSYAGFAITAVCKRAYVGRTVTVTIDGTPTRDDYNLSEVDRIDPVGVTMHLQNAVAGLEDKLATAREDLAEAEANADAARDRLGLPFDQEQLLDGLVRRQEALAEELSKMEEKEGKAA